MIAVRLRFSEPTATVQYSPKQWRDLTKVCWAIVESAIVVEMWSHQSRYCGKLTLEHNGCDIYSMLPLIVSHNLRILHPSPGAFGGVLGLNTHAFRRIPHPLEPF